MPRKKLNTITREEFDRRLDVCNEQMRLELQPQEAELAQVEQLLSQYENTLDEIENTIQIPEKKRLLIRQSFVSDFKNWL